MSEELKRHSREAVIKALRLGTAYLDQLPPTMRTYLFDVVDDSTVDLWIVCRTEHEFWLVAKMVNNFPPDTSGTIVKKVGALVVNAYMEAQCES